MPYQINKGIGKGLEVKGFKGKWIFILVLGMLVLLLIALVLQNSSLNPYVALGIAIIKISVWIYLITRANQKYGEHGLAKHFAGLQRPKCIIIRKRRVFYSLKRKS